MGIKERLKIYPSTFPGMKVFIAVTLGFWFFILSYFANLGFSAKNVRTNLMKIKISVHLVGTGESPSLGSILISSLPFSVPLFSASEVSSGSMNLAVTIK